MTAAILGVPGKLAGGVLESVVVGSTLARQVWTWLANMNRLRILPFAQRRFPDLYGQLDGGDKRILRGFLDPESVSNFCSLLLPIRGSNSEYGMNRKELVQLLEDALGTEAAFDNSFVEHSERADGGSERWFFINGIMTSRDLARRNVYALRRLFNRPITLVHNPTQGLTNDLMEAALQKFTNTNTEPAARAFLEIAGALLDDETQKVVVLAHSQGTIITGDVLDLLYVAIDHKYFDRTNLNDEDLKDFTERSWGTVKSAEIRDAMDKLKARGIGVMSKLELYMFANGASRMCYIDEYRKIPHIESYANEHDIVTRLGSLARDDFHREDLIRIDGSLFTCNRYGHLLNAHYLPDFVAGNYKLRNTVAKHCIGSSIHDPVRGNPCRVHPKHVDGPSHPRLQDYVLRA